MMRRSPGNSKSTSRRGITAVWLIVSAPLLITVLGLVLNIGFRWLGRAELRNAAVSGALGGAQVWGKKEEDTSSNRAAAIRAAKQFVHANSVSGGAYQPGKKSSKKTRYGRSVPYAKTVLLGSVEGTTFVVGGKNPVNRACLVEAIVQVEGPFGWLTGPSAIRATAAAVYDKQAGSARMVHITRVIQR